MSKKIFITIYDLFAKLLLAWFVFQSFMYFYTGRFLEEIESLKHFGRYSILLDIYSLIQIPVAAIGAVVLIPLILKGYKSGLVVGILYWIMGYIMNPLWYAFPRSMQATCVFPGNRMSNPHESGWLLHVKADSEAIKKGQIISLTTQRVK
jgi:hypothetical protein